MGGSKSSSLKRTNKYSRNRDSSKIQKQTMQCLNPMQLGPPASKSKGESLSSKLLLNNAGVNKFIMQLQLPWNFYDFNIFYCFSRNCGTYLVLVTQKNST